MEHVTVHGTSIPTLGFGTWDLTGRTAYESVRTALEVGYRHIDTAQIYRNEDEVGRAIADSDVDRDEVFVSTKVWHDAASQTEIQRSHEQSLKRLGLDHVDLLLIHWPTPDMEVEAVVKALDDLRQQGKTRLIGVSNYTPELLERAVATGPVVTNQVEYHPFLSQDALLEQVHQQELTLTAYSPLAKGRVIGDDVLEDIGGAHGKSAAQVAIRWLYQQDRVLPIPRSSNADHIRANFEVFDFELSDDEMKRVAGLASGRRQTDPAWGPWN